MAISPADAKPPAPRATSRLRRAGWSTAAAAFVFASLAVAGRLSVIEALLGALVVALAGLLSPDRSGMTVSRRPAATGTIVGVQTLALLAGLPDPVVALDRRGVVLAFNKRARAALPALRTGDPLSYALRTPEVLDAVKAVTPGGAPLVVAYAERVPVERWIEAHVAAVRVGGDAGAQAIVLCLRDLTEQRRSERMRADFVANASHELRTPLASLLGFIETLQGPAREDVKARERFLEIMRTQANRMSRLIDDLLSLSRIELKAHVRPETQVELTEIARTVVDGLAPLASERGVAVEILAADGPVWTQGDRDELIRVAENLIENAIKYGASGRRVEIAVSTDVGKAARFAVRDFGPGIAIEHLPRLTERFYRVDVADSRDKGGTGLGLALVKHILQRHGGRLAIQSEPGLGATFVVTLELAAPPADMAVAAERLPAA
jgi:two-component system phosphate regulon sensor histidine kinase PhoR